MEKAHESVTRTRTIKQGTNLQRWAYGNMTAIGSAMPAGGARGSTYKQCPSVSTETLKDIELLFEHAKVSNVSVYT